MKHQASLVLTLLSVSLFSEIDIQTLSDWTISDFDPRTLFVAKGNQTPKDRKASWDLRQLYIVLLPIPRSHEKCN